MTSSGKAIKMKNHAIERRDFLRRSGAGLGMAALTGGPVLNPLEPSRISSAGPGKPPREVWIASLSLMVLTAGSHEEMIQQVLKQMEAVSVYKPDIICLPETFPYVNSAESFKVKDVAETPPGPVSRRFARFAKDHDCHVICPIYTMENGSCYNSAVVIDRNGSILGEYRKMHPTEDEIENGVTPGPETPPVFKTDFGVMGVQICFDIEWPDGWRRLRQAGAEIVFWPSAFAGGVMVNTRAWENKYPVVSSTWKDTTKICDVSGEEIAKTGRWNPHWAVGPVNLEKAFVHTWPYVRSYDAIQAKYGRGVKITSFHEEEWTVFESLSPDVRIADVLKEFDIRTHEELIRDSSALQEKARKPGGGRHDRPKPDEPRGAGSR
jgi:beta-ureidopropionase